MSQEVSPPQRNRDSIFRESRWGGGMSQEVSPPQRNRDSIFRESRDKSRCRELPPNSGHSSTSLLE